MELVGTYWTPVEVRSSLECTRHDPHIPSVFAFGCANGKFRLVKSEFGFRCPVSLPLVLLPPTYLQQGLATKGE